MFSGKTVKILTLVVTISLLVTSFAFADRPVPAVTDGADDSLTGFRAWSHRLIVELQSPAVARWYQPIPDAQTTAGRLDPDSVAVKGYIARLAAEQTAFAQALSGALPRATVAAYIDESGERVPATYQVVMNAIAIDPGTDNIEAAIRALRQIPGVKNVYRDYAHAPTMYASIPLIDAPAMWEQLGGQGLSGEGILVASIDTGVHALNPFFDPTGYEYPPGYPVGDAAYTTEKVIGARLYVRDWDPPLPDDDTPWPGPAGSSHGTHTAGTAAGNAETEADFGGLLVTISGVAPRAQILSYRISYPTASEYSDYAFDAEILMAFEDAVLDGADVINYSFGGYSGVMPWASATAVARDAAWDAGVFVSHSAGNEGPGPSTVTDASPKAMEVAASTTTGTLAAGRFNVTAPEPIPPELLDIAFATADFGEPLPIGEPVGPYFYVTSDSVDPANFEGCNPWPPDTFTGLAAVISRGTCEFGTKVLYAEQAGAVFVVIRNHEAGGDELVYMGAGEDGDQVTITSIFVGYTDGLNLVDWYDTNGAASEFAVDTTPYQVGNEPDVIADFSSRGPAFASYLEPDVTAPGVNILSAGYAIGATGEDRHLGFGQASGTSMAAPHVAGAAALLRQLYPDWTPTQIRSALMSTSVTEVWLDADHTVPAGVLDMGAGRIDLGKAGDPGLTFDYPSLSFGAQQAGVQTNLTVMATNVSGITGTYSLTVAADAGITADVNPTSLSFAPGETKSLAVTVDTTGAQVGDYGGMVWLDDGIHLNHLPLWVRVEAPLAEALVLLVDNDMSDLLELPDYTDFYTRSLTALGVPYDYYNTDLYAGNPQILPSAPELAAYDVIIYWTGDNYYAEGALEESSSLTLLDLQTLTDWQFAGGRLLATGQDLASAWDALDLEGQGYFIYAGNLGTKWLQDSIFDPEEAGLLPPVAPVVGVEGSPLSDMVLDISGSEPILEFYHGHWIIVGWEDGAGNQYYVDEIEVAPYGDTSAPETIKPLFEAITGTLVLEGHVAASRADGPTLEEPQTAFDYRTIYLSFGFESINNETGYTTREEVMEALYNWLTDQVAVTMAPAGALALEPITLQAAFTSTVGAEAVQYRWDLGDGSDYAITTEPSITYDYAPGIYWARVEVTDAYGHTALSEPVIIRNGLTFYLPLVGK